MLTNHTPVESQTDENLLIEASIVNNYIHYLHTLPSDPNNEITKLINNFVDKCEALYKATLKSGATDKTVIKDLKCVMNLLAYPEPENLLELHKRIRIHQGAVTIRNKVGIPSTVSGGALFAGAVVTFFVAPTIPLVATATAAVAGIGLAASGTGVVVDARLKRNCIAECEEDILNYSLESMLLEKKYIEYAFSQILILKYDAQIRSENTERDNTLDAAIMNLKDISESELEPIIELFNDLKTHLTNNSNNSDTAKIINELVDKLQQINEKASGLGIKHNCS